MNSIAQTAPAHAIARPADDTTDIGGLLTILRRHLWKIMLATIASTLLALAYLAVAKPLYTASTTLLIDPRSRKVITDDIVQGGLGSDVALVESQVAVITSDAVLSRVVAKLNLDQDPEFAPPRTPGLLSAIKALVVTRSPDPDPKVQAVTSLSEAIRVKRAQKTYIVDIDVTATTPVKAARLADAVVVAYLEDQTAAKASEARRVNALIDSRLGELREQVRRAETHIDEFKKTNKILQSDGGFVNEQQLSRLNGELVTARGVAAEAKARFDQVNSALKAGASPETLPDALRSGLVQRLREQYAQVARREAAVSSQLQPRHPVVIEVRSQLAEIKAQIAAELKRIATSAKSELDIATNREAEITRTLERSKDEVSRNNTAQIKLRELEQEANAGRELLRVFLARAKETQEQQNVTTPDARVISAAALPNKPSRPLTLLVLSLGILGGLGLGLSWALFSDHLDPSIRNRAALQRQTGLRTLGEIPALVGGGLAGALTRRFSRRNADTASAFSDLMTALTDSRVPGAPAYRQAVLRLTDRLRGAGRNGATIMFAAPHSNAGTSATALAVAFAAAEKGERVLLVDASSQDAALSAVFAGGVRQDRVVVLDNREHLNGITVRDTRTGLAFLPIALVDLRTLKNTQRRRLLAGIQALASGYDLVVIDGGALLEDESALCLAPAADGIVLIARAGETPRHELSDTAQLLEPVRERFLGVALTMTDAEAR